MTITYNLDEIDEVAEQLLDSTDQKVFLLYGDMGVGKTTLVKAIARVLGVSHETNSPTFGLVNEYEGAKDQIYHFDLYRLEDEEEVFDIGLDDYIQKDSYIFIEWPEKIERFLGENCKKVHLTTDEEQRRIIAF